MRQFSVFLPLVSLLAAMPALADEDSPDTVVVTANREPQPLSRVGQAITVIDQVQIVQRQSAVVVDLLRDVPGVTFSRNGGVGSTTSVYIRGAESEQSMALIDGVKLNDPSAPGGGFNFGNLLVGNIERIEVLRGPSSVLWGSQAIGGVINMITLAPTETPVLNLRAEGGYRGTGQIVGNFSGKYGPLSASVGAGYFRTDGISAFDEALGGKERDGYRNFGANAKFNLALNDAISVDLRGYYSDGKVDFDGFPPPNYSFGDTLEYGKTREFVGYAGLNAALFDGRLRNRFGYAYTDTRRRSYDPTSADPETFASNGRNERLEYQGAADLARDVQATFGVEREISKFDTSSYGGPVTHGRASINSVYGQIVATPLSGLTLTAGVRRDDHDRFGGATTFAGSGVWTPNGGATTIRASYSEGFKAPSLYQLQSEYGNDLLRPERSRGYDAGITQRLLDGAIEASATWFHRDSRDLINFVSCAAALAGICLDRPYGTYDNVARARAQGVELSLLLRPHEGLTVRSAYGYVDAENRVVGSANFGKKLALRPSQSINVSADYRWTPRFETGATLTHVGRSFDNAANTNRLQGYVVADIRASFDVTQQISVYGRIENLFDEKYETIRQYGALGRAAYAGVRLRY
jgi:vitamin B12 transporter